METTFKLIILGNQYCGKTSLFNRISDGSFLKTYTATIGIDYCSIKQTYNNKDYKIVLWDTSGQDKFDFMLKSYLQCVTGAIVMYDITDIKSLNAAEVWINEFRERKTNKNLPIMLLSNKIDLESMREVPKETLNELKEKYNIHVLEVSTKENINIEKIIPIFIEDIEEKLINNVIIPNFENGVKINKFKKEEFEIDDDKNEDPRCCNIL